MKKEQTLLLSCAAVGGLLVWQNSGLYASVGADQLTAGASLDVRETSKADPRMWLRAAPPAGRTYLLQKRFERRPDPPPPLTIPPSIGSPWVRPRPSHDIVPAHWTFLREPMAPVAPPAVQKPDGSGAETGSDLGEEEDPEAQARRLAEEDRTKAEAAAKERIARAAKVVWKDGSEKACRLTPLGEGEGQAVWIILERWGQVPFKVEELNPDGKSVMGSYNVGLGTSWDAFQTVHLEKTLDNEYHEERIRRGVRDGDRQANIEFANWIRSVLAQQRGYGIPAVRLAMKHLMVAKAIQIDAALISLVGETAQECFDVDEEVRAYLEYLQGPRASETPVMVRLGDAYERAGALHAARDWFEKAAKLGDSEGGLRSASLGLRLADGPADLDAVYSVFEQSQGASASQKARALAGMSRVRLRQGDLAKAVQLASDARAAEPASFEAQMAYGAAQYTAGRYAEAESAFGTAAALERGGSTRAKSSRAMALLALDKLPEAVAEAEACLRDDALNYLDPLLVLGEAQQRWGELAKSNGTFETALQRSPRNPWILQRLATIRLRDDRPDQALELLLGSEARPGIREVAPECVDGLRVTGLAYAAQEKPDWASAIRYLRRALEKDPRSADIVYDLAKVLAMAGRLDDAIALLERATSTESASGFAKSDARLLSLLGWALYTSRQEVSRVYDALNRAKSATQASWTPEWVTEARAVVTKWDSTRIWTDTFDRTASARVGNGWDEVESLGTQIGLAEGRCTFFGKGGQTAPAAERKAYTGLTRTEDLGPFERVSATFKADAGFELVVHLYIGELRPMEVGGRSGRSGATAELGFGRDRNGNMVLYSTSAGGKHFNLPLKDAQGADRRWPEDGQFHTVTLIRTGDVRKGIFQILLDDEVIATPEPLEIAQLSASSRTATFGIHVDADRGQAVNLWIDTVEIEKIVNRR